MGKRTLGILALLVVVGLGFLGYRRWRSPAAEAAATAELHFVRPGVLEVTIDAAGNLAPARERAVAFEPAGRVVEVLVAPGEVVTAGQAIARLDASDLALERDGAAASLRNAESGLAVAQEALGDLADGPDEVEIALSQISLDQAKDGLWSKQMSRDATCGRVEAGRGQEVDCDQAEASVLQGEASVRSAQLQHEQLLAGPTRAELRDAQGRVDQAASQLASARTQLARAERDLAGATLTAPFTGTVMTVDVAEGDRVTANQAAATIADLSRMRIEVLLGETDVAKVALGQPANVTVEALPDAALTGEVVGLSPAPELVSGVVLYPVIVELSPGELAVRSGMSASAAIVTTREEAVLTVPLRAVSSEGGVSVVRLAEEWPRPEGLTAAMGGAGGARGTGGAGDAPRALGGGNGGGQRVPGGLDPEARATMRARFASRAGGAGDAGGSTSSSSAAGSITLGGPMGGGGAQGAAGFARRIGGRGFSMSLSVPLDEVTSRAVPVTLGTRSDTVVVVSEGLSPGDVVVIERAAVVAGSGSNGPQRGSSMAVPIRMGGSFRGR